MAVHFCKRRFSIEALALLFAVAVLGCGSMGSTQYASAPRAAACFDLSVLPGEDRAYADSLLGAALGHEALYTLYAPIKPMSSMAMLRLPVARADSLSGVRNAVPDGAETALGQAARFHRVAQALRCGALAMVVVPYRRSYDGERILQMSVVDTTRLNEVLRRDAVFWGQWGFVPGADPATVVTTVEFEEPLERFRGYGYLFGYPEYAVDFFVEAAREEARTGAFVERDFFHIPVHAATQGYFTYAIPKGHRPTAVDSTLYRQALDVLQAYNAHRLRYVRPDGSVRAADLLRDRLRRRRP